MELSDSYLCLNCDWDPSYLHSIFDKSFDDCSELWINEVEDSALIREMEHLEHYCPIVEDMSIEDEVLCNAAEQIENE